MAPTTPIGEPATATAGDSWIWKQTWSDYPVSEGWALSYVFAGPSTLRTTSAQVTNDSASTWTVTIPASATTDLPAGTYTWNAFMTGSGAFAGRRDTVGTGLTAVALNSATAEDGALQLPAEKLLAAIDAVIYGRVTDDVQRVMIAGRQIDKIPILELFAIKSRLERQVSRARGGSSASTTYARFG